MKPVYRFALNIQMFAGEDDVEEDVDVDGEVIGDDEHEDNGHDGGSHRGGAGSVGLHQALTDDYWKQFFEMQKMHHEKAERILEDLKAKVEDLDRRHQAIPASVRAEIEALLEAEKQAGHIDSQTEEEVKKKSKYSRH